MYPRPEVGEAFDSLQAPPGNRRERISGRNHKIAERLARGAPYTSTQLVQFAKSEVLRVVDDYSVDIRHVDAAFDNGGGQKHIIVMVGKINDGLLQLFGW